VVFPPASGDGHDPLSCSAAPPGGAPGHLPGGVADPLIGAMVGSFRLERLLGRGGMGTVYLGCHPIIGSRVAVKFLHESLSANPDLVGRFYDEARAVNLIGHENIVAIYDLGLLPPGRYYIVMEYLEGSPLSALLRTGRVEPRIGIDVLLQLADALRVAHDRGVVHRDLKPENVFLIHRLGRGHFVKLVDFGIAKLAGRESSARTAAGALVGTPEYMAPEQCDNRPIDRRTDVYALGIMAYELATGRLPFTGPSVPRILLAQLGDDPTPPRRLAPDIPQPLEDVILRALAKRPEDRYPDMAALAAALEDVQRAGAGRGPPPALRDAGRPEGGPPGAAGHLLRGGAAVRRRAAEVTPGGLFVCCEAPPPPLFSSVRLRLRDGERDVEISGEVVRHVSAEDAARWQMQPGFAVQLDHLDPSARSAIDALASRSARPPDHRTPLLKPAPLALAELELRAAAGPYTLLGCGEDAEFADIRGRVRSLRAEIEALRSRLPPVDQASRVPALLVQLDSALSLLGNPSERILYDARHGNFRGVAHSVTAGTPPAAVEARRRALLAEQPEREAQAERHRARAQVACKLGNEAAALAEYEAALAADPLDLSLHQAYWDIARKREGR
jgi:tRNA A-37 threonylcarbamoyl transferase component Bud32